MAEQFKKVDKTSDEIEKILNYVTRKDLQPKEVHEIYAMWADVYEQDLDRLGYTPPLVLTNEVAAFYGEKRDLKILDAASGTGMVGELLHTHGFKNLDALDASAQMLEKAKEKGIYGKLYQEFLGKNRLNIPDETYDAVVTTGSFVPGHVNEEAYEELVRITKKGGHIFILMNERYFQDAPEYTRSLEPRMLELQEQGVWKRVIKKTDVSGFVKTHNGVLFVLEKC